mmetsp:Transcript_35329/g.92392  ORF Transcript_35329/g.92392 Transcript_35329/m.92392 type:complete len:364 (+) Transcript_35329:119-1210(+)
MKAIFGKSQRVKEGECDPTKRFKLEDTLGKGAFATVYKALDRSNKSHVAIKKLALNSRGEFPVEEYEIGRELKHPNIVTTIDCFYSKDSMYMVLELVNEGDLFTKLDPSGSGLPESTARKYMMQLASGLAFMHSKDVVHCDIKPENLLVHNGAVKICDLGLAGKSGTARHGSATGTGAYMAPELLNRKTTNPYHIEKAQDVWSFGIVLYAVLFADLPWEKAKPKDADFRLFCTLGGVSPRLHPFHFTSAPMMQFLRMVLNIIPKHRPTMANCVDFFSRKIAFYVTDKSNLKISYGLKEIKEKVHKTKEWEFDTGHSGAHHAETASNTTSSSSLPSMMDMMQGRSFEEARPKRRVGQAGGQAAV